MSELRLIVGLGNPGSQYESTRHNVGFDLVDRLSTQWRVDTWRQRFKGLYAQGVVDGHPVGLLKPMTFMNLSGESITAAIHSLALPLEQILVICDDVHLPLGKLRIRRKGSCGGHRGLLSIEDCLGTSQYPRLRIGIGPAPEGDLRAFVLSEFTKNEREELEDILTRAAHGVVVWLADGIETAMNSVNG